MIPDDIRRFVLTSITSVPHIEALLLFCRTPGSEMGADDLARGIYIPEQRADELLRRLSDAGFITLVVAKPAHRYRYEPADLVQGDIVARLSRIYAENLLEVTNLIHSKTASKAQQFSDAFKLRKE